jgi:hypothetical protein
MTYYLKLVIIEDYIEPLVGLCNVIEIGQGCRLLAISRASFQCFAGLNELFF